MTEKRYILAFAVAIAAAVFCTGAVITADFSEAETADCSEIHENNTALQPVSSFHAPAETETPIMTMLEHVYSSSGSSYEEITVTFDANGGELDGDDETVAVLGQKFIFSQTAERTGYEFVGWNSAQDGSGETIISGNTWYLGSDTTLYAQWKACCYKLILNGTFTYGEKTALPDEKEMYRPGFVFEGWYCNSDFSGDRVYYVDENFAGDQEFFAKYARICTVTFNANGGTLIGDASMTVLTGEKIVFGQKARFVGHTLVKWTTSPNGSGESVKSGDTWVMESDVTLYAQWKLAKYNLYFEDGGCQWSQAKPTGYTYGETVTLPGENIVSKEGYKFMGWYDEPDFSGDRIYSIKKTDTGEKTFYAKWAKMFTVTFCDGDTAIGTADQICGEKYQLIDPPEKEGCVFAGWFTADGVQIDADTVAEATDDFSVFAKWTGMSLTVTVTIDGNGGKLYGESQFTATIGEKFEFVIAAVYSGYKFTGLNTAPDGSGEWIRSGDIWTIESDVTLYAQWTQ